MLQVADIKNSGTWWESSVVHAGHLDDGRCRGCWDPETLANLCPRRERQYVDCDTTVVDCEGSVMDKAVAFANINAFFTEGLATRESYWWHVSRCHRL